MTVFQANYNSALGHIQLTASEIGLQSLCFVDEEVNSANSNSILEESIRQLDAYFKRELKSFNIPLDHKGTEFQLKVWNKLLDISFGKTMTYVELAMQVATNKHTRAVGLANGANPVNIIIPCHRVIGRNGKLRGYGGGIDKKEWLLDFESESRQLSLFE
ncbi:MAG: methylated-DNA--[protein]-cysteine S-methyltransferase [Bacteroidetes bacterium]|nr:methylated-DNA--[protein]-cysteine S-methyltransferase [Bacteroidota bacterium]MBL6963529.1 methylated-DNA--[protein]-cysteine S-methyltransferase [Bacteroidota bacterium]